MLLRTAAGARMQLVDSLCCISKWPFRDGDALPKRVQQVVETGNALVMEA